MEPTQYPSDEEFLEVLKVYSEELSPDSAPITYEWISNLYAETKGFLEIGESLTAKRLALSLIGVLGKMEHEYRGRT